MSDEAKKFKLREEKHVTSEILLESWSPTMDLIAFSNANGEVIVNRLSWQRVWSVPALDETEKNIKVAALSWRPDGKTLAIGYTNGLFRLCEVEKGEMIGEESGIKDCITSMVWLEQAKGINDKPARYPDDTTSIYLPTAHQTTLMSSDNSSPKEGGIGFDAQKLLSSHVPNKDLSLLVVGTSNNKVHLYAYGIFHLCVLELETDKAYVSQVVDSALLSPDLARLFMVVKSTSPDVGTTVHVQTYDTALLVTRHEEIRVLCSKVIRIIATEMEISNILEQMCEAWEDILREMDSKLLKFAKHKKETNAQEVNGRSVSNDFLELLLFGTTSLELQNFLLTDLTDKGLKKLGYSIENSYSNIQKLVVRQLQRASQNLTALLSDLWGMSQWKDKFGMLGLEQDAAHTAMQTAKEFNISAYELQQMIDASIKNFKAFFRWLYIAILRLSNEHVPAEINKMTQHDVKFVADFLKDNFTNLLGENEDEGEDKMESSMEDDSAPTETQSGFRLEKVGQYLRDTDLTEPPDYNSNLWIRFVQSSTALKASKLLPPTTMQSKSMKQRKQMVVQKYSDAEKPVAKTIGNSMKRLSCLQLCPTQKNTDRPPKVLQFIDEKTNKMWRAFSEGGTSATEFLYLSRHPVNDARSLEVVRLRVGAIRDQDSDQPARCSRHLFLDFAVFNAQTLTLLLLEVKDGEGAESVGDLDTGEHDSLLVQLPLSAVDGSKHIEESWDPYRGCKLPTVDVGRSISRTCVSVQPRMRGQSLSVGGVRKTASIVLTSQRRIRLFLLEDVDDDDDDEDEGIDNSSALASDADESKEVPPSGAGSATAAAETGQPEAME